MIFELYAGAWLFTDNHKFRDNSTREQSPIGVAQGHVIYDFRPGLWASVNATFLTGGRTRVDEVRQANLQQTTRYGFTLSVPLSKQHSLKFAASTGAYSRIGADFNTFSVAYQYLWF